MDTNTNIKVVFKGLKKRIKTNEGYSNKAYKDQLGYQTIGFGHLIRKKDEIILNKVYSKKYLETLFEKDFKKTLDDFNKNFKKLSLKKNEQELLIEMIYQMGIKKVLKFKKVIYYLKTKQKNMVCLEMMKSLWYKQTPKRVLNLIYNFKKN